MSSFRLIANARTVASGDPVVLEHMLVLNVSDRSYASLDEYREVADRHRPSVRSWRPSPWQVHCIWEAAAVAKEWVRFVGTDEPLMRIELPSLLLVRRRFEDWKTTHFTWRISPEGLQAIDRLLQDPERAHGSIRDFWLRFTYWWMNSLSTTVRFEWPGSATVELSSRSPHYFHLPWVLKSGPALEQSCEVYDNRLSRLLGRGLPRDFTTRLFLVAHAWESDFFRWIGSGKGP